MQSVQNYCSVGYYKQFRYSIMDHHKFTDTVQALCISVSS